MSAIWRPDRDDDRLLLADSGRRTDHDRLVVLINSVSVRSEKLRSYGLVYEVMGERRQKYQAESLRHLGPNQEGTWISRAIIFREGYSELVDLIERADRASNASRVDK
jgi:hypothetical protein